ncbi:MAG: alpha/beta fold hydrolase [Hyphomicrobiales bacterium]|nr:alpha/beta fold hydrolase [Hyphomicrobiales bacterium]
MPSEIRYARSDNVNIAYQIVGEGATDLVFVMGWVSHLDYFWQEPSFARFLGRLASTSRLILFDKRGTGLSDRGAELPTLEQRMDDVRAVMDSAGSSRAVLLGISEGAPMCALFAATYPERTAGLIMIGGYARRLWDHDYPWGAPREDRLDYLEQMERGWGTPFALARRAPSVAGDERFRAWWATYLRMSASPGAAVALTRMNMEVDVRAALPAIQAPTLIIHRTDDLTLPVEGSRYMAERIPGARYVELPGNDHLPFVGDQDAILDEVEHFLTGIRSSSAPERILTTVLVVEIANATEVAARQGDRNWRDLTEAFAALARRELAQARGRPIRNTEAGLLAIFDGPARAIRCAAAIVEAGRVLGVDLRAGLHSGECDLVGDQVEGIAVETAVRVMVHARPGETLATSTVRDLVAGSGIAFESLGVDAAPGISGELRLFRIVRDGERLRDARAVQAPTPIRQPHTSLSRREQEVAPLIALGLSNRQIAEELAIAEATVERHVANILTKLGYHSRVQIAAWAVEHGLLRAPSG